MQQTQTAKRASDICLGAKKGPLKNDRWDGAVIQAKPHVQLRVNWALRLIELMNAAVRASEAIVDKMVNTGKTVFYA